MSGLLRNLIAVLIGLCRYATKTPGDSTLCHFWVTPFDSGIRVLKSDKYLQYAETAQLDYLLQVGRLFSVLRSGVGFINVAQQLRFLRPVPLFSRVRVQTQVLYADEKCAYFIHDLHTAKGLAAQVLVKMKFKKGRATVAPATFLDGPFGQMPVQVQRWEMALQAAVE